MNGLTGRRLFRIVAGALFTAVVVALIYNTVSPKHLVEVVRKIDLSLALVALFFYVIVTSLRGWRYVASGANVRFRTAFQVAALHSALLRIMPLRSGELVYGVLIKQAGGSGFVSGMASIFLLRVLDLAVVLPLAAVVIASKLSDRVSEAEIAAIATGGVLLSMLFFFVKPILRAVNARLDGKAMNGPAASVKRVFSVLMSAYELPMGTRLLLVGITVLMWAVLLVWCHFAFLSIGAVSVFGESMVASVLGILGSILPLSLIGSFGPMEGGFALGLSLVGQDHATSLANALIGSSVTFLCGVVVAAPAWIAFLLDRRAVTGETR